MPINKLEITRVLAAPKTGSSRPIVAQTAKGKYVIKLRGAAQGTGALVAEIIVSSLAQALGLPVLEPSIAVLGSETPSDDKEDELADLLAASVGINLAFPLLEKAREAKPKDFTKLSLQQQAATLWLDRFVLNPDRTVKNPNMLVHDNELYLIDFGSSLSFQYNWESVTETSPLVVGNTMGTHVFEDVSETEGWRGWDSYFAECISREVLNNAVDKVPASFLEPLLSEENVASIYREGPLSRRRAAYVAFLWKRLKSPRRFASEQQQVQPKSTSFKMGAS